MSFKTVGLSVGLCCLAWSVEASTPSQEVHLMIKAHDVTLTQMNLQKKLQAKTKLPLLEIKPMAGGAYTVVFDSTGEVIDPTQSLLKRISSDKSIKYAVEDRLGYFKPVPDPKELLENVTLSHEVQWNQFKRPAGIMLESAPNLADGAWAYTRGAGLYPVVVSVLDTGVVPNKALDGNLLHNHEGQVVGWNFADNNDNLLDETGSYHGTHVSGIIASYGSPVMVGVGDDIKIITAKIPNKNGMFYESSVINGIYWSVGGKVPSVPDNPYPAQVLNMSFGVDERPGKEIDYCDEPLQEAIFYARKKGAVLVAAAGNDNRWEHYNAPAVCNGVIKVASTGPEGLRAYYSNYGPGITIAAPGGDKRYGSTGAILSTVLADGGYMHSGFDFYQGTSMASPHVAGVAALVFAASHKNLTTQKVEQILFTTTHDFGKSKDPNNSCVGQKPCGHGILDAEQAVKAVIADYTVLFSAPPKTHKGFRTCEKIEHLGQLWVPVKGACGKMHALQRPSIKEDKQGNIVANYGNSVYKLDQSSYSQCKVIGYDGVGCFGA
jgi:serine protease